MGLQRRRVLCGLGVALAGCQTVTTSTVADAREREICDRSPSACVDGHLRATPLLPKLPDLSIDDDSVVCYRANSLFARATIRNLGNASTDSCPARSNCASFKPGPVDVSATINGQTFWQDPRSLPTLSATGSAGDNVPANVRLDGIDSYDLTAAVIKVWVNPPEQDYPAGWIWESNVTNNTKCAVCTCTTDGCTSIASNDCRAGP